MPTYADATEGVRDADRDDALDAPMEDTPSTFVISTARTIAREIVREIMKSNVSPEAERFIERVIPWWQRIEPATVQQFFHPEARIRWLPNIRRPITPEQLRGVFERITQALPDVRVDCLLWAARENIVFAELRITASVAGEPLEWGSLDRFTLRGERAIEQVAYLDLEPLRARGIEPGALLAGLDLGQD